MQSITKPKEKIRNKLPLNRKFALQPRIMGRKIALKIKYTEKMTPAVILEILGINKSLSIFQLANVAFQLNTTNNVNILKKTK